jgi:cellobiose phosphorylase
MKAVRSEGILQPSAYGHFSADGREYRIHDPHTPRPWINLIANPRIGLAVSQTGSGFSWIDNSQLGAVVRWQQEFADDRSGRFLYLVDLDSGAVASLTPAPVWSESRRFACRHGLGYTTFESEHHGVGAEFTLSVDARETVETWRVRLENRTRAPRRLLLVAFLEWNCGTSPAPRREFQKLFLETAWEAERGAIFATSHMWDVGSKRWGHWNTSFPYWSAFAAAQPVAHATGDKAAFLGRAGSWARPAAIENAARGGRWQHLFGRHHDPVAAIGSQIELEPGAPFDGGFVLATAATRDETRQLVDRFAAPGAIDRSLDGAVAMWDGLLASHRIVVPEPTLEPLLNDWLRYQAISARLWGRAGYYQQSGAFGFRDQLQDSQVWLTIDPQRCREQARLHAAHQFRDGSVVHWWHPLTEQGHVTRMTDDLLWLGFVVAAYLRETGDVSILDDEAPYLDEGPAPLVDHVERAFRRVFERTSPRGLPYLGAGDWNDGLSAAGLEERGESVWLAMFLAGLLHDWSEIHRARGDRHLAGEYATRRVALIDAVNTHAWDGAWYRRATRDDGVWLGSAASAHGKIYLNAQTWAVLADVAPPARAAAAMASLEAHLVTEAGALLLQPAYDVPDERVGYITRYAPGLRENGGVYTHAAVWAIAAAAKVKDPALVERLLTAINPSNKDPESYWAEPYVLPGNVDGPQSPLHGRAGWTWYTGSAAWLPRIVSEWVLGVRPTWDGLLFDPCLPTSWTEARMTRPWRGATLEIHITRDGSLPRGSAIATADGHPMPGNLLPSVEPGTRLAVRVRCG